MIVKNSIRKKDNRAMREKGEKLRATTFTLVRNKPRETHERKKEKNLQEMKMNKLNDCVRKHFLQPLLLKKCII